MTRQLLILLLLLTGCARALGGGLSISHARAMETIPGQSTGVAYMTVHNPGTESCTLVSVGTPRAGKAEVHEHRYDSGKMQMRAVPRLAIAAGASLEFKPGGYHLMLLDLPSPMRRGEDVAIKFDFGGCGEVEQVFRVISPGER